MPFGSNHSRLKFQDRDSSPGKLPAGVRFKLLHLGDLHLERLSIREEKINQIIKADKRGCHTVFR